jgi:hypothetical protein
MKILELNLIHSILCVNPIAGLYQYLPTLVHSKKIQHYISAVHYVPVFGFKVVDERIRVIGIMMEKTESFHPCSVRKPDRRGPCTMSPAFGFFIFFLGILRIMNEQVGSRTKSDTFIFRYATFMPAI